jgi:hypothetical protein
MNLSRKRADNIFLTTTTKALEMKIYMTCTILAIVTAALTAASCAAHGERTFSYPNDVASVSSSHPA